MASSTLPPKIVSDVLSRLPVKSLIRFRCVSKPLCSTIDGPDFARLQLKRSVQSGSNQSLVLTNCPILHSVDLASPDRAVAITDHPVNSLAAGSCDGLLCLCSSDETVVLWNMSTRKHLQLPDTPIVFPQTSDRSSHRLAYGLAYDSPRDDYKVVRIVRFLGSGGSEVMVYSVKSNSWRRVCGFHYDLLYDRSGGVLADGALHWITNDPRDSGMTRFLTQMA